MRTCSSVPTVCRSAGAVKISASRVRASSSSSCVLARRPRECQQVVEIVAHIVVAVGYYIPLFPLSFYAVAQIQSGGHGARSTLNS